MQNFCILHHSGPFFDLLNPMTGEKIKILKNKDNMDEPPTLPSIDLFCNDFCFTQYFIFF